MSFVLLVSLLLLSSIVQADEFIHSLEGTVSISGMEGSSLLPYPVSCKCAPLSILSEKSRSKCKPPLKMHLSHSKTTTGKPGNYSFDLKSFTQRLGHPADLREVLLDSHYLSCSDGRIEDEIIGTPGGDIAEIMYILSVLQEFRNLEFTEGMIDDFIISWLLYSPGRGLSYHTDTSTLVKLSSALGIKDELGIDLTEVNPKFQEELLRLLSLPDGQGCIHLMLLMRHTDLFGISPDIPPRVIRSFFRLLWMRDDGLTDINGKPLFEYLKVFVSIGNHDEESCVLLKRPNSCTDENIFPLVAPNIGGHQNFVFHPTAIIAFRHSIGRFVSEKYSEIRDLGEENEKMFMSMYLSKAGKISAKSMQFLCKGIPKVKIYLS